MAFDPNKLVVKAEAQTEINGKTIACLAYTYNGGSVKLKFEDRTNPTRQFKVDAFAVSEWPALSSLAMRTQSILAG
jgi:hypothetical protein